MSLTPYSCPLLRPEVKEHFRQLEGSALHRSEKISRAPESQGWRKPDAHDPSFDSSTNKEEDRKRVTTMSRKQRMDDIVLDNRTTTATKGKQPASSTLQWQKAHIIKTTYSAHVLTSLDSESFLVHSCLGLFTSGQMALSGV